MVTIGTKPISLSLVHFLLLAVAAPAWGFRWRNPAWQCGLIAATARMQRVKMNEAARLTLVALGDTCARHVIEKLRREVQRIESADDADSVRDHVVNAFCTAWHVHQWMWDTISERPDLKCAVLRYRGIERQTIENHETFGAVLAGRFVPLKICRMIATSSRYVKISSTAVQANMSVADPAANGGSVRSKPMIIVMGRPVAATRLLLEIDDYWVTMILDCGIE